MSPAVPDADAAPARPPTRRVLLTGAVLVAVGALGQWLVRDAHQLAGAARLSWPVLLALCTVVEASVLHVQVRREAQTVSMSEIPLVLGLFLAAPLTVVTTRVVGSALVCVLYRRQAPLKVAFNLALAFAEASTGLAVFHLVVQGAGAVSPRAWTAAYVAVGASALLSALAVALVIAAYESGLRVADLRRALAAGLPVACLTATLGLIATNCLILSTATAWLLAVAAGICVLAYRAYASLADRHLSLERLYRFSQVVGGSPGVDEVIAAVLAQARDLLRAESADLVLLPSGGSGPGLRISYDDGRLVRTTGTELQAGGWLERQVVGEAAPALVTAATRAPGAREYLEERGVAEAVVAPLRGDGGVVGALVVADRMGSVRSFSTGDVQLLETVANHAAVALENGRLVDRLRHDALHDALTGLANRVRLEGAVREAVARRASGAAPAVALLLMDLDRFKEVNDTLGHLHGDLLLREVAERLRTTAPPGALVARLGGDEFAVVLPDVEGADDALEIAHGLLRALEAPTTIEDVSLEIGGSIGIAVAPQHGTEVGSLLKCADVAMYAAKGTGRGVQVYRSDLDDHAPGKLVMATELRAALAGDEIEVHAQPKARLGTGAITGVEVLVRWRHPTRGLVPPDEFIPVAERTGLLRPLTATVLGEGIAACARWYEQGLGLGVSVNLSTRSLLDPDLVADVLALLEAHRLPPRLLTLEITEGSVMTDLEGTCAVLERLHEAGVRLAVDDFGTGYSSLSYLSRLPVDEVKIDKHFVLGMRRDPQDAAIVRSVIDLGANLGLEVTAEGVEDAETWERLDDLGCDTAQGYHLSRAMPLDRVAAWVLARPPVQARPHRGLRVVGQAGTG